MASNTFPRSRRLVNSGEFDAVFKQPSCRASCAEFLVLALGSEQPQGRLGIVVSKKVAGTSVNRNRLKRLIRESFRRQLDCSGLDLVVVCRPGSASADNALLRPILEKLWQQISTKFRRAGS